MKRLLLVITLLCGLLRPALAQGKPDIAQYLNIRSAVLPSASVDGSRVAYLTNVSGVQQLWLSSRDGNRALTNYTDRVSFAAFSPDGSQIVFGMDSKGNERTQLYLLNCKSGQIDPLTSEPRAIHRFGGWSADGKCIAYASNERNEAYFDVYVVAVPIGKVRCVLQEDDTQYPVAWSPDGRALVLAREVTNATNELYLLDLASGQKRLLTPRGIEAMYDEVRWPAGSSSLYLTTNARHDLMQLARLDTVSGRLEFPLSTDWEVTSVGVSRGGKWIAWVTDEDGYGRLHVARPDQLSAPLEPKLPSGVPVGLDFSGDERSLLLGWSGPKDAADIWQVALPSGQVNRVTHSSLAEIAAQTFVEPTLVHYVTFDRKHIPAFFYKPAGWSGGAVILSIHGGPESQERVAFSPLYQYFLRRGYAILAPNIRGSSGYGKVYLHLDDRRNRGDAIEDIACAAKYLQTLKQLARPPQVVAFGGSYGGYMTLAALAFHPELFAAGVDICGIANLESFLRNTGAWRRKQRESEYGYLDSDLEYLRKFSPIHKVDAITAPLMVIQGAQDPRVPREEAEQIVNALRQRGRAVEYLLFENEGHGLAHLDNRIKAYGAADQFIEKYLKP